MSEKNIVKKLIPGIVERFQSWKSLAGREGADFLAPLPTLLYVCRPVAAVTVIHTTMLSW